MRICFLATTQSIHTRRWASWFAQHGHEVHIISFESSFPAWLKPSKLKANKFSWNAEVAGITVHHVKTLPSIPHSLLVSQPLDNLRVKHIIRKIKPDIVHGHVVFPYGFYAACSGFHPSVLTTWGSDVLIAPKQSKISSGEVNYAMGRVDLITTDAEHMVGEMIRLGASREKIEIIHFGTDTRKFNPGQRSEELRRELGIVDSPTIISARGLNPVYNVETLILAIPMVLEEFPEAKFIIAGKGSQRENLENLTISLGVAKSTKFVGRLSQDELPQYLASSDIYVSTSLSDAGLSASTAEAMACGLPVVITDFGDNRKWVEDNVNGFVIHLRDPEALASKIIYLLHNKDDRIEFGRANRRVIQERNDWGKEMGRMEKLYYRLIERHEK